MILNPQPSTALAKADLPKGGEEAAGHVHVPGGQALQAEHLADVAGHLILGQHRHQVGVHLS